MAIKLKQDKTITNKQTNKEKKRKKKKEKKRNINDFSHNCNHQKKYQNTLQFIMQPSNFGLMLQLQHSTHKRIPEVLMVRLSVRFNLGLAIQIS